MTSCHGASLEMSGFGAKEGDERAAEPTRLRCIVEPGKAGPIGGGRRTVKWGPGRGRQCQGMPDGDTCKSSRLDPYRRLCQEACIQSRSVSTLCQESGGDIGLSGRPAEEPRNVQRPARLETPRGAGCHRHFSGMAPKSGAKTKPSAGRRSRRTRGVSPRITPWLNGREL